MALRKPFLCLKSANGVFHVGKVSTGCNFARCTSSNATELPSNLQEQEETQKIKFSPLRSRDVNSEQVSAKLSQISAGSVFGRGVDSNAIGNSNNLEGGVSDQHASVYDQANACSLSSVMQTNVPLPYSTEGDVDRSGHLCMPGGQWAQNDKYVSSDLHEHHHTNTSKASVMFKFSYNLFDNSTVTNKSSLLAQMPLTSNHCRNLHNSTNHGILKNIGTRVKTVDTSACHFHSFPNPQLFSRRYTTFKLFGDLNPSLNSLMRSTPGIRFYTTLPSHHDCSRLKLPGSISLLSEGSEYSNRHYTTETPPENTELTSRQKLQRAVKEYGTTVIVFHVTISLASLGFFYLLVSSGLDMTGIIEKLGIDLSSASGKEAYSPPEGSHPIDSPPSTSTPLTSETDPTTTTLSTTGAAVAGVSTFVVAYAIHKVFAPARIAITLTSTPIIVRTLRAKGILKPPVPK